MATTQDTNVVRDHFYRSAACNNGSSPSITLVARGPHGEVLAAHEIIVPFCSGNSQADERERGRLQAQIEAWEQQGVVPGPQSEPN